MSDQKSIALTFLQTAPPDVLKDILKDIPKAILAEVLQYNDKSTVNSLTPPIIDNIVPISINDKPLQTPKEFIYESSECSGDLSSESYDDNVMYNNNPEEMLIAITWKYKPFCIDNTYVGTKDEICEEAQNCDDCMFECNQREFIQCLDNVCNGSESDEFQDKWHGFFVISQCDVDTLKCSSRAYTGEDKVKSYINMEYNPYV